MLLDAGARVAILDLRPAEGLSGDARVKFFETDITSAEDIARAVEGTVAWAQTTGARLGGVVNCAGVGTAAKVSAMPNNPRLCSRERADHVMDLPGPGHPRRASLA